MLKRAIAVLCVLLAIQSMAQSPANVQEVVDIPIGEMAGHSVSLSGPWAFYWNALYTPGEIPETARREVITLPKLWEHPGKTVNTGFATYRTVIRVKEVGTERLGLYMPDVYSSYRIWINGTEFKGNGVVGATAEATQPEWLPRLHVFDASDEIVEIVLQIANFHHSKGGISQPIYVGFANEMKSRIDRDDISNKLLFATLILISLIVGGIYFVVQEKNKAMIFYICLCLSWAVRVIFSNGYIGVEWFPAIPWQWVVRLEYLSLYMSTVFGMLFIAYLFRDEVNKAFRFTYVLFGGLFTLFTIATPPLIFTQFVQLYLAFSALLLIAIFFIVVSALINLRAGATFFMFNIIFGVLMFGYVILAYQRVIELDEMIFSMGFGVLFISTGLAMAVRLTKSARGRESNVLTYDQLYKDQS